VPRAKLANCIILLHACSRTAAATRCKNTKTKEKNCISGKIQSQINFVIINNNKITKTQVP